MSVLLPAALAVIAFLYALVGHGGASGYIALLTLLGYGQAEVRPSALVLNLFVSAVATFQFARAGHFRWRLFLPFALASVPMAWLGAQVVVDPLLYKRVLAVCLIIAGVRLLWTFRTTAQEVRVLPVVPALGIGLLLGFVSGMIGIGGGILLSPVLLLFRWADAKQTAAVSAAFILVNSAAGLLGTQRIGETISGDVWWWIAGVVIGGMIGSWVGAHRVNNSWLRRILGVVLLSASLKLLLP
ncbi:MAG: sulfite exporter TauE/SafE family protein [Flavobacteriales bacterium]|nr:sulfite exporter TauE/SafE family protein [Flavobacteriales bacterium]MCC6937982.1 sulfite exporter TauE/SafE family protein [Flavobacteriales bacterium]